MHLLSWTCVAVAVFVVIILSAAIICSRWFDRRAQGRLYDNVEAIPARPVALVLGTVKFVGGNRLNYYFKYRMEAAERLYKAGKVKHFILSGDNHRKGYDEPTDMKDDLMARGVPESAITLDYAGFRTLDSVVRCKEIFSQAEPIVISQPFHNARAIFIGDHYGMKIVGLNARSPGGIYPLRQVLREYAARVKAILDIHVLHKQPHFLGEKIELPLSSA